MKISDAKGRFVKGCKINLGRKFSEEHRRKLSEKKIGNKNGEGWKPTEEQLRKMRIAKLGGTLSEEHKRKIGLKSLGHIGAMRGKHHSEETKKKLRESLPRGENHPLWKGGITPEVNKIRSSIESKLWNAAIFSRDNWSCKKCNIRGGRLSAHHIKNFSQYPEIRFAIDNGVTLCHKCHTEFHKFFGKRNNTKEQLLEFGVLL